MSVVMTRMYIKRIDCPEHPGQHKALLHCWPMDDAGYWSCIGGAEDYHDCIESAAQDNSYLDVETTEAPSLGFDGEYQGYEVSFYVCAGDGGCGRAIDSDVADPAIDAAEARADYEADNWRDE